jgi:periplasmic protein TonB
MKKITLILLSLTLNQFMIAQDLPPIYFEKAAQFPGGDEQLMKAIQDSMKYPPESLNKKIGGRVIIITTIDSTGHPKNIKIIRGINAELDSEAIRIIRCLPPWEPAESTGKKMALNYTIPISFDPKKNIQKNLDK